jgi:hypothetical protein
MSIPFKCQYVIETPTPASAVPANSLFVNSSNLDIFSVRNSGGIVSELATSVSTNPFIKSMQSGGLFPINVPLTKLPNGTVVLADSNSAGAGSFCGYSTEPSLVIGQEVVIMCCGPNITSALSGLGFAPGDMIYINENGGYTNDPSTFTGDNDTLVRVGLADCAGGPLASPIADDLITFHEYVAS